MEVLAGFLLGYILGTDAGGKGVSVMKDAIGSVAGSGEVQSVMSGSLATAQGFFGGLTGSTAGVKDALGTMAANEDLKAMVSAGLSTATGMAAELFGRGKEMVSAQRGRGLRLVI